MIKPKRHYARCWRVGIALRRLRRGFGRRIDRHGLNQRGVRFDINRKFFNAIFPNEIDHFYNISMNRRLIGGDDSLCFRISF